MDCKERSRLMNKMKAIGETVFATSSVEATSSWKSNKPEVEPQSPLPATTPAGTLTDPVDSVPNALSQEKGVKILWQWMSAPDKPVNLGSEGVKTITFDEATHLSFARSYIYIKTSMVVQHFLREFVYKEAKRGVKKHSSVFGMAEAGQQQFIQHFTGNINKTACLYAKVKVKKADVTADQLYACASRKYYNRICLRETDKDQIYIAPLGPEIGAQGADLTELGAWAPRPTEDMKGYGAV
ncbi:hypothetical protein KCU81_g8594, partial [Aureobasidium melanogenum]|uniref:Uncharacterized protein n=1 Tax=Aureobasidium melanogenum (strain CBS 110374) TaxID=1043003 RepID=A0A074WPQ1_AURM1